MARRSGANGNARRTVWVVLRWIFSTAALAAALAGLFLLYQRVERMLIEDPRFALRPPESYGGASPDVRIEGIVNASRDRVLEVFAEDAGKSLYLLPAAERRERLLAVDWVRDASVARLFPNRLEVRIAERQPAAFVRLEPAQAGALFHTALIDSEGVILEIPTGAHYDLPVLTGIRQDQDAAARALRVRRMMGLFDQIDEIGERISEVDVENPNNLKVTVNAGGQIVQAWLGRERFLPRLRRFLQYFPEARRRYPAATTFDLRLDDRITVIDGGSE